MAERRAGSVARQYSTCLAYGRPGFDPPNQKKKKKSNMLGRTAYYLWRRRRSRCFWESWVESEHRPQRSLSPVSSMEAVLCHPEPHLMPPVVFPPTGKVVDCQSLLPGESHLALGLVSFLRQSTAMTGQERPTAFPQRRAIQKGWPAPVTTLVTG